MKKRKDNPSRAGKHQAAVRSGNPRASFALGADVLIPVSCAMAMCAAVWWAATEREAMRGELRGAIAMVERHDREMQEIVRKIEQALDSLARIQERVAHLNPPRN